MKNRMRLVVLALAFVASIVVTAPSANAASTSPSQAVAVASGCSYATAGQPYKSGTTVKGGWAVWCPGYWNTVSLERQRWWGWETLASTTVLNNGSGTLSKSCAGTGTYTYRTRIQIWVAGAGTLAEVVSKTSRFSC